MMRAPARRFSSTGVNRRRTIATVRRKLHAGRDYGIVHKSPQRGELTHMLSLFAQTIAGLSFCCLFVTNVTLAQPSVNITVSGKLGPVISGTDPLGLSGASFKAITSISPVGVTYSASSITYTGLTFTLAAAGSTLACTGASATVTLNDPTDSGNDTFALTNCTTADSSTFTATLAFPPNTLPSPIPLAYSSTIVSNPDTASTGTYVMGGNSTTLGVSGNTTAVCNQCPA